jgi:hypothetical protein
MTEQAEKCPACGSERVARGRILGGIASVYFRPSGLRFWTLSARVPLTGANKTTDEFFPPGARACTECGLLWSRVNPALLAKAIREGSKVETRKKVGESGEEK